MPTSIYDQASAAAELCDNAEHFDLYPDDPSVVGHGSAEQRANIAAHVETHVAELEQTACICRSFYEQASYCPVHGDY